MHTSLPLPSLCITRWGFCPVRNVQITPTLITRMSLIRWLEGEQIVEALEPSNWTCLSITDPGILER